MTVSDSLAAVQLPSIDSNSKEESSILNPPHPVSLAEILNKTAEASTKFGCFLTEEQFIPFLLHHVSFF